MAAGESEVKVGQLRVIDTNVYDSASAEPGLELCFLGNYISIQALNECGHVVPRLLDVIRLHLVTSCIELRPLLLNS